jgi:hypothetical protein
VTPERAAQIEREIETFRTMLRCKCSLSGGMAPEENTHDLGADSAFLDRRAEMQHEQEKAS